jgi:hypothetical protein
LSKTSLRSFGERGPAWWKLRYIDRAIPDRRPEGATEGLALDCLLTEGLDQYIQRFIVRPKDIDLRTKDGKQWRAMNEGKELLSAEDGLIIEEAAEAVSASCIWKEIDDFALAQHTIRADKPRLGFGFQARPDWIRIAENKAVIYDLKKTRCLASFGRQAIDLGYHLQAAVAKYILQEHGIEVEAAFLIAVEWERGARCRVYQIPENALRAGSNLMVSYANDIYECMKSGVWSESQDEPEPLPIPEWLERGMA